MTLSELIEQLQAIAERFDEHDPEVRLAYQRDYPLEGSLAEVGHSKAAVWDADEEEDPEAETLGPEDQNVVWLCEGSQLGYASKHCWEAQD